MLKVRANLYALASWYANQDFQAANKQPRFNRQGGPVGWRPYKLSPLSAEANHYWHLSEDDVWPADQEKQLRKYYNAKRRSGEMAQAIAWEKPLFEVSPSVNWWRSKLNKYRKG